MPGFLIKLMLARISSDRAKKIRSILKLLMLAKV